MWNLYYDHISYELVESIPIYLDLIFDMFRPENISREDVESGMYERLDDKTVNQIYFNSGELIYFWVVCRRCNLSALN
jgi:hypothetical protein